MVPPGDDGIFVPIAGAFVSRVAIIAITTSSPVVNRRPLNDQLHLGFGRGSLINESSVCSHSVLHLPRGCRYTRVPCRLNVNSPGPHFFNIIAQG